MINKIGLGLGIRNINFKADSAVGAEFAEEKNITKPDIKVENKGLETLAIYNSSMISKPFPKDKLYVEPLLPTIINPEDVDKIDGERIYSSDGKLHSIVRRDEETVTVYTPSEENEKMFSSITTYDKATGKKPLLVQKNVIEDGKYVYYDVNEYNPEKGEIIRSTGYDKDGNIDYVSKTTSDDNGKEIDISYYYDSKEYYVCSTMPNKKDYNTIILDNNKQIIEFSEEKKHKGHSTYTEIDFYNGAPYKVELNKTYLIPNRVGWEKFRNNEELKPATPFEKIKNLKEIEGEKTYYSNGALESNTFDSDFGKSKAFFNPDGRCYKITSDKKDIEFENNEQVITERLDNGKEKITTILNESGIKRISLCDTNSYQEISYNDKNRPLHYSEGVIKDGEKIETSWLSYDEDTGMVDYAKDYAV